jgi:hypothetical protein
MLAEARAVSRREDEMQAALTRLEADGFIVRVNDAWKTSRRWQRAMARAAVTLYEKGDPGEDLRVPIAFALLEAYAGELDDEALIPLIEAILPIENAALGLSQSPQPPAGP